MEKILGIPNEKKNLQSLKVVDEVRTEKKPVWQEWRVHIYKESDYEKSWNPFIHLFYHWKVSLSSCCLPATT